MKVNKETINKIELAGYLIVGFLILVWNLLDPYNGPI